MPQKRPYLAEADKGAFLGRVDDGLGILPAVKRAKIHPTTVRRITKHSNNIQVYNNKHNLPPLSMHDRVTIKSKPRHPRVLSEVARN
jgi:hypothetical protein